MRELISTIEGALGPERLARLRRDEDAHQQFWLGVLEALRRADLSRESVSFLISNGYGAIRNMRRAENSRNRMRHCPACGRTFGSRTVECPDCLLPTEGSVRVIGTVGADGEEIDFEDVRPVPSVDMAIDVGLFLKTLGGRELYVARRWLAERADMTCKNHIKQIAWEMGVSGARVSALKASVREKFKRWYWGR